MDRDEREAILGTEEDMSKGLELRIHREVECVGKQFEVRPKSNWRGS